MKNLFYILLLIPLLTFAERITPVDSYGVERAHVVKTAKYGVYMQWEVSGHFRWADKSHYTKFYKGEVITHVDENGDGIIDYDIIDVAQAYNRGTNTDGFVLHKSFADAKGSGDTLFFEGNDWTIEFGVRQSSLNNFTVVWGEGMKLIQSASAWNGNPPHYKTTTAFVNNYPNNMEQQNDQAVGLLWAFVVDNLDFICEGEFEGVGVYPQNYPGDDPSPTGFQNTEKGHHFMKYQDVGNMTWDGGYIHNFSDDAFNIIDLKAPVLVQNALMSYNKRLGLQTWSRQGKITVYKCHFINNGMADVNPVWGTNTRHGATLEPNNLDESEFAEFIACVFIQNADSGIGIHAGKIDDTAPIDLNVVITDCHFEDNGQQADATRAGAFTFAATDIFVSGTRGDNPQGGLALMSKTRVWGDKYGFFTSSHYTGSYGIQFTNPWVYKVETTTAETNPGLSIIDLNPRSTLPSGSKVGDIDLGTMTVVHGLDEYLISIENKTNLSEIESTVVGDVYLSGPGSKQVWQYERAITDNSNIAQTRVALGTLMGNTVNVSATTPNAVKSSSTNGQFTFTISGGIASNYPRAVHYSISTTGTNADERIDFESVNRSVTIPPGQTSATVDVVPLRPSRTGENRNIILTITPKNDAYTVGNNNTATVFLIDLPGSVVNKSKPLSRSITTF